MSVKNQSVIQRLRENRGPESEPEETTNEQDEQLDEDKQVNEGQRIDEKWMSGKTVSIPTGILTALRAMDMGEGEIERVRIMATPALDITLWEGVVGNSEDFETFRVELKGKLEGLANKTIETFGEPTIKQGDLGIQILFSPFD